MDLGLVLVKALGGLGLFLYGMKLMSEGLQKVAGDRLRSFLEKVSSNRIMGAAVGMIVTALVQSSSLTTVTVVGFVNAGLINLTQSVGVILGANVGTTVTAQIIAFKITHLALVAIFIGMVLKLFAKKRKWQYVGEVILGFGILFFGMSLMKDGFKPLRSHPEFIAFFTRFDAATLGGVLLCVAAGAVLTMVVQSSSATVGITMALASQGLLTLPGCVALILGENIGTTITAELASIGGNLTARRAARAHTMFNVIGVCLVVIVFNPFINFVEWLTSNLMGVGPAEQLVGSEKPNITRYIANSHSLFNVLNAVFFLCVLPLLVKAAVLLTPGKDREDMLEELGSTKFIDNKFVDQPSVALALARDETARMGQVAKSMFEDVTNVFFTRSLSELKSWRKAEEGLDQLQKQLLEYLVQVSQGSISGPESREIASMMRMVNNMERIGDSVENLAELIGEVVENDLHFSDESIDEYTAIRDHVDKFINLVVKSVHEREQDIMSTAQRLEDEIDLMREHAREDHVTRLRSGVCMVDTGLVFMDMLSNFEKIGDYCYNISQAVSGRR
jgi:phosphate:Na+ symporter